LTVTGTCTGCGGGGGGSGTVNSGTATQLAMYPANGTAVSGDSGLTDSGTTLTDTGSYGISAAAGTFSGNVTVNGQLMVAGPWLVSSPIPGTAMAAAGAGAGAGTSALGISNDGNFYISANAGTPRKLRLPRAVPISRICSRRMRTTSVNITGRRRRTCMCIRAIRTARRGSGLRWAMTGPITTRWCAVRVRPPGGTGIGVLDQQRVEVDGGCEREFQTLDRSDI
jgi:hypothetical protein